MRPIYMLVKPWTNKMFVSDTPKIPVLILKNHYILSSIGINCVFFFENNT